MLDRTRGLNDQTVNRLVLNRFSILAAMLFSAQENADIAMLGR
jgi:hypothetical protein